MNTSAQIFFNYYLILSFFLPLSQNKINKSLFTMAAWHISLSLNCVNQPGYLCAKCSHSRVAMLKLTRLGVCLVSALCSLTRNVLFMSCVSLNIQHTGVNPEHSCLVFGFVLKLT